MPVPLVPEPLPLGAARAHGAPLLRITKSSTPAPGNVATGAAVPRISSITMRSDAVTRASFTSPAFFDAQRAVASALTTLPTPAPQRTASAPLSATAGAHARAAHARAARARAARADPVRVEVVTDRPVTAPGSSRPDLPALRLADLAPAVVKQLPEVEGVAWYRLRADGGGVARVAVPASDVVDAMRLRIRALEGKVIKLEDLMEKEGEMVARRVQTMNGEVIERFNRSVPDSTALRRKKSVCSVGGSGFPSAEGGDYNRSRVRGHSSLGVAYGFSDSSIERGRRGKRRSVDDLMDGGKGARTRGIWSVFGGRRARSKARASARSDPRDDNSKSLPGAGTGEGAERLTDAPGRVEIGSSAAIGWGEDFSQPKSSSSGPDGLSMDGPLSAVTYSASDLPSRAFSANLPRGCTVWDSGDASLRGKISSADSDIRVGDGILCSASWAADGVSRGNSKFGLTRNLSSRERGDDFDRASGAAASMDGVGSTPRSGHSCAQNSRAGIRCHVGDEGREGSTSRHDPAPDEKEAICLSMMETIDSVNLATSSVSSDSGGPGGRMQKQDVAEEPDDDLPDAPDAPSVVLPSQRGYKNVKHLSAPRSGEWDNGAELNRQSKFSGEGLRWSARLRRAGSGRY